MVLTLEVRASKENTVEVKWKPINSTVQYIPACLQHTQSHADSFCCPFTHTHTHTLTSLAYRGPGSTAGGTIIILFLPILLAWEERGGG